MTLSYCVGLVYLDTAACIWFVPAFSKITGAGNFWTSVSAFFTPYCVSIVYSLTCVLDVSRSQLLLDVKSSGDTLATEVGHLSGEVQVIALTICPGISWQQTQIVPNGGTLLIPDFFCDSPQTETSSLIMLSQVLLQFLRRTLVVISGTDT